MGRERVCILCGVDYLARNRHMHASICPHCETPQLRREGKRWHVHVYRAQKAGVSATLTLAEWITTLNHFGWKCAYCLVNKHSLMEHIVSIKKGGGTTATNVVPACSKCNSRKDLANSDIYG